MKYQGQQVDSAVESYGVVENQVGIDAMNVDFLATLLTSNLYSNPLHSFLRETIANAWDSHVEANNTDTPVILLIEETDKEEGSYLNSYTPQFSYRLSIRDFGTGLSKERFENIYRNIGSSTKRDSNDYIGAFGIGRFSALACKNQVNITSFYNGKRYNYLMYKNGGKINIDQMSVTEGDFKNGLEVSIENYKTKNSILKEAILQLQFFKKLYIEYKGSEPDFKEFIGKFNNRKCFSYNNFAFMMVSDLSGNYIKMGSVLYKVDNSKIVHLRSGYACINVPIGSIDITPNRETVQYTEKTIDTIKQCYIKAKKELSDMVTKNISDFDSLVDFYNSVCSNGYKINLDGSIRTVASADVELQEIKSKIKGVEIPQSFVSYIKKVGYADIDKSYIYKSYNLPRRSEITFRGLFAGDWKLAIKKDYRIKEGTLKFFRENHNGEPWRIVSEDGLLMIKALCKTIEIGLLGNTEECTDFLFDNIEMEEILNSNTPKEYFAKNKTTVVNNEDNIRWYEDKNYGGQYSNEKIVKINKIIKEEKKNGFFIYTLNTRDDAELKKFSKLNCNLILGVFTCKESQLSYFENRKIFVRLENLLTEKNKFFQKLFEAHIISNNFYRNNPSISWNNFEIYNQFCEEYKDYVGSNTYYFRSFEDLYRERGWLDQSKIDYYAISNADIKIQTVLKGLEHDEKGIFNKFIRNIVFTKTGNKPKIGLTRETILSKKQIINQMKEYVEKILKLYKDDNIFM